MTAAVLLAEEPAMCAATTVLIKILAALVGATAFVTWLVLITLVLADASTERSR